MHLSQSWHNNRYRHWHVHFLNVKLGVLQKFTAQLAQILSCRNPMAMLGRSLPGVKQVCGVSHTQNLGNVRQGNQLIFVPLPCSSQRKELQGYHPQQQRSLLRILLMHRSSVIPLDSSKPLIDQLGVTIVDAYFRRCIASASTMHFHWVSAGKLPPESCP